jgi:hypothetical protein
MLSTSALTYTLDETSVTVPARGDASVRVTSLADATGTLTAAGGDVSIHTTLANAPATVALTVRFTDRAGAATTRAFGAVYAADGTAWDLGADGAVNVPKGTYTLDAKIFESGGGVTLLNRPALELDRDTTVQMDARLGRTVAAAPPQPAATQVYARVAVAVPGGATTALQAGSFDRLTAAQIGAGRVGLRTEVAASWTQPGVLYSLAWPIGDRFITGFSQVIKMSALAAVRAEFGASEPGTTGLMTRWAAGGGGYTSAFDLPSQRTEYLSPGAWNSRFTEVAPAAGVVRVMTAGSLEPVERWNKGVFGPAFPPPTPWGNEVSRTAVDPAWSADATHGGPSPGAATIEGDRIAVGGTTWTFRPSRAALLPLSVVRFEPRSATALGFLVQHQVAGTTTTKLELEVSYDDGQTWQTPLYSRIGERGVAFLRSGGGPVSLRVTAVNSAGSSVEQAMIRAYKRG